MTLGNSNPVEIHKEGNQGHWKLDRTYKCQEALSECESTSQQGIHRLRNILVDAPAVAVNDFHGHIKSRGRHALYDRLLAAPPLCLFIAQRHPAQPTLSSEQSSFSPPSPMLVMT